MRSIPFQSFADLIPELPHAPQGAGLAKSRPLNLPPPFRLDARSGTAVAKRPGLRQSPGALEKLTYPGLPKGLPSAEFRTRHSGPSSRREPGT
ncbi:hypothetical protein GCM10023213_49050 [Prosthecobacter algae]|uniref:Uncharacterized protein n=1 Tax=Prosthecobacter algae TaxID=1144682 RepID=A0ABP9PQ25_9BACT